MPVGYEANRDIEWSAIFRKLGYNTGKGLSKRRQRASRVIY